MTTTLELEDDLSIEEAGWRSRFLTVGAILLIAAFAAAAVYYFFMRDETAVARATEEVPVRRTNINSSLIISGIAEAQLSSDLVFQTSGKVGSVDVRVGDTVKQGQVLASLESENLANGVSSAQASLRTAQLKLADLQEGSSAAELAAARQAVAVAEAGLTKAENDYQDLLDGSSSTEVAAAEQSVRLAESQLATAKSARQKLEDTPSASDLAAAEAGVASAESALTAAENAASSAKNSETSAAASLKSAESSYCAADGAPSFCATAATPISSGDASLMDAALSGSNATLASGVITANSAYLNARNARSSADAAVDSAENALASAEEKLDLVKQGPSDEEVSAADAAVTSAESALAAAQAKLDDALNGATDLDISTASAGVDSARATLNSAAAKLEEALRGPEANALDQARQAVETARLAVDAASIRVKDSQIIAPFDGTVAAVNITAGEFTSLAGTEPAIVLLTPDAIVLEMDVGETDYPNIKKDQGGVVIFDGLPGAPFPFKVTEIGLSPKVTQGVVTYGVTAALQVAPNGPRPAPGMNGRGQMVTDSKPNLLVIPPRAIRRRGLEQVVDVKRPDGTIEETVIATGITDNVNVEITSGLNDGDIVIVPKLSSGPGGATGGPTPVPTLPGGIR